MTADLEMASGNGATELDWRHRCVEVTRKKINNGYNIYKNVIFEFK